VATVCVCVVACWVRVLGREGPARRVFLPRLWGGFWRRCAGREQGPCFWLGLVKLGRQAGGPGWGELPGSPSGSPLWVPALSVTLRGAAAVTVGESVGDISGPDDFDSAGFHRLNVVVGQRRAEVLKGPALIDRGVVFGQPG
jgi:hypothetical protein